MGEVRCVASGLKREFFARHVWWVGRNVSMSMGGGREQDESPEVAGSKASTIWGTK
jgi:hypothetical protein